MEEASVVLATVALIREQDLMPDEEMRHLVLDGLEEAAKNHDAEVRSRVAHAAPYFATFGAACVCLMNHISSSKPWASYSQLNEDVARFVGELFLAPYKQYVTNFGKVEPQAKSMVADMLRISHQKSEGRRVPSWGPERLDVCDGMRKFFGSLPYTRYERSTPKSVKGSVRRKKPGVAPKTRTMWIFDDMILFGVTTPPSRQLRCSGARVTVNEGHLFLYAEDELEATESLSVPENIAPLLQVLLSHLFRSNSHAAPQRPTSLPTRGKSTKSLRKRSVSRKSSLATRSMPQILQSAENAPKFPHTWSTKQLNKPHWCTYCKEFIYGLFSQALSCPCGHIIHRKCKFIIPDDCGDPSGSLAGKRSETTTIQVTGVEHVFELHHFSRYTHCAFCEEFIWGLGKQGYKCAVCSYPVHKECLLNALPNCSGKSAEQDATCSPAKGGRSMNRAAMRSSLGITEEIPDDDWNRVFVLLEGNAHLSENELVSMMSLIAQKEGDLRTMDPEDVHTQVLQAEVSLAKGEITSVWDRQQELKLSRSNALSGFEVHLDDVLAEEGVFRFLDALITGDEHAQLLLDLFAYHDRQVELISYFVRQEVEESTQSTSLFRGNTLGTMLLRLFLMREGRKYLADTLPLADVLDEDLKLQGVEGAELEKRQKSIHSLVLTFLGAIVASGERVPTSLYTVCHLIVEVVEPKYGSEAALSAVGGFIFLRFVTPAILMPDKLLGAPEPTLHQTMTLTQVAKVIQFLVNRSKFSEGDALAFLSPLLDTFETKADEFLAKLAAPREETPVWLEGRDKEEQKAYRANLSALRDLLKREPKERVMSEAASAFGDEADRMSNSLEVVLNSYTKK